MNVFQTIISLRSVLAEARIAGQRIAFVPTMGNLHQGHLDLVARAKELADIVVVSIFVNPLQFGAGEDLDKYPRTLSADIAKLEQASADILFAPDQQEIYGDQLSKTTQVIVPELTLLWCGASRPGHFDGVATVVNKLFNIVQPEIAVFGEKDFQQLSVIRKMVHDLNIPVQIESVATRRGADGLAMSSRNGYLTEKEREIAPNLRKILLNLQNQVSSQQLPDYQQLTQRAIEALNQCGFKTDYIGICRQSDLQPAQASDTNLVILAAAYLGKTRLIDNIIL